MATFNHSRPVAMRLAPLWQNKQWWKRCFHCTALFPVSVDCLSLSFFVLFMSLFISLSPHFLPPPYPNKSNYSLSPHSLSKHWSKSLVVTQACLGWICVDWDLVLGFHIVWLWTLAWLPMGRLTTTNVRFLERKSFKHAILFFNFLFKSSRMSFISENSIWLPYELELLICYVLYLVSMWIRVIKK